MQFNMSSNDFKYNKNKIEQKLLSLLIFKDFLNSLASLKDFQKEYVLNYYLQHFADKIIFVPQFFSYDEKKKKVNKKPILKKSWKELTSEDVKNFLSELKKEYSQKIYKKGIALRLEDFNLYVLDIDDVNKFSKHFRINKFLDDIKKDSYLITKSLSGGFHVYLNSRLLKQFAEFSNKELLENLGFEVKEKGLITFFPSTFKFNGKFFSCDLLYINVGNLEKAEIESALLKKLNELITELHNEKLKKIKKQIKQTKKRLKKERKVFKDLKNVIKEVKKRVSFRDIISEHFVKSCINYDLYHCPFHLPDEDPSFVVYRNSDCEIAIDFHDDKTYDIISFYQAYYNLDFKTTLKELCKLANIEFEFVEKQKKQKQEESIYKRNDFSFLKDAEEKFLRNLKDHFKNVCIFENINAVATFLHLLRKKVSKKLKRHDSYFLFLQALQGTRKTTLFASDLIAKFVVDSIKMNRKIKVAYLLPFRATRNELYNKQQEFQNRHFKLNYSVLPRKIDYCEKIIKHREQSDFPDFIVCLNCNNKDCRYKRLLKQVLKADVILSYIEQIEVLEKQIDFDLVVVDEAFAVANSLLKSVKIKNFVTTFVSNAEEARELEKALYDIFRVLDFLNKKKEANSFLYLTKEADEYQDVKKLAEYALEQIAKLINAKDIKNLSVDELYKLYKFNKKFYSIYEALIALVEQRAVIAQNEIYFFEKIKIKAKKIIFIDAFSYFTQRDLQKIYEFDAEKIENIKIFAKLDEIANRIDLYLTKKSPRRLPSFQKNEIFKLIEQNFEQSEEKRDTTIITDAKTRKKLKIENSISHFTALATNEAAYTNIILDGFAFLNSKVFHLLAYFFKTSVETFALKYTLYETLQELFRSRALLSKQQEQR